MDSHGLTLNHIESHCFLVKLLLGVGPAEAPPREKRFFFPRGGLKGRRCVRLSAEQIRDEHRIEGAAHHPYVFRGSGALPMPCIGLIIVYAPADLQHVCDLGPG